MLRALADIGYEGYVSLETPIPSGSLEDGMRRNLAYIRGWPGLLNREARESVRR